MGRKRRSRLYTRFQGGGRRFYGDFRDYSDVGGKREALVPFGAACATEDEKLAQLLVSRRLADLEDRRRRCAVGEPLEIAYLSSFSAYHLDLKAKSGRVSAAWLEAARHHLASAVAFFSDGKRGVDRPLAEISVSDVQRYVQSLAARDNGRGQAFSPSNQRKYLNSLSNLFRRAISERRLSGGHNPVAALMEKPQDAGGRSEAKWLEVDQAALLLESCRAHRAVRPNIGIDGPTLHGVVATMLLTGGRPSEVFGLAVSDVSFDRRTITFRPNEHRGRLKTALSLRTVPMWPQLAEILRSYLPRRQSAGRDALLFPSVRTDGRISDLRKALDSASARLGWANGSVRPYAFRHTYCAARLQTLDNGAPVSAFTVAREMGHGGMALVNRVYGHLGEVRHRSEAVEYRIEQHAPRITKGLARLHLALSA